MASTMHVTITVFLVAGLLQATIGEAAPPPSSVVCGAALPQLAACAPFILPNASSPSSDCCSAISSINTECLCSTLNIVNRLPSACKLPSLTCPSPHGN